MNRNFAVWRLVLNPVLVSALAAMVSSQLFKAGRRLAKGGKPDLASIADYGGFPSSHSAFITACAFATGITQGFDSAIFALAGVCSAIFLSDILRLRLTVHQNKLEVDRLLGQAGLERLEKPPQFGPHSLFEVVTGVAWGCACATVVCLFWP